MRLAIAIATSLPLLLAAGPARAVGFEYGYATIDAGMGGPQGYLNPPTPFSELPYEDAGVRFSTHGHVLSWHDESGYLTAALNGYYMTDYDQRYKDAVKSGSTLFWYTTSDLILGPLVPGQVASLTFGFGSGTGADLTFDNKTYTSYPTLATDYKYLSYHADLLPFSLRSALGDRGTALPWLDLVTCFNIEARGSVSKVTGSFERDGSRHTIDRTLVGAALPLSLVGDVQILPLVHLQGTVGYELLGGLGKLRGVAGKAFGVEGGDDNPLAGQPLVYGAQLVVGAPKLLFGRVGLRAIHSALGEQLLDDTQVTGGLGVFF